MMMHLASGLCTFGTSPPRGSFLLSARSMWQSLVAPGQSKLQYKNLGLAEVGCLVLRRLYTGAVAEEVSLQLSP